MQPFGNVKVFHAIRKWSRTRERDRGDRRSEMEQVSPGQMKKYIKQLKQREEQYLYYLGQLAFQAGEEGKLEDPGMLEAYRTLKDVQAQAVQWETSLQQMKAAKEAAQKPRCTNCGEVVKGAAFCPGCGAPVTAPPATPAATAPIPAAPVGKVCASCGGPLDDDAVFCGNCGTQVAQAPAQGESTPPAPPAAAAPVPPTMEAAAPPSPPADATVASPAGEMVPSEAPGEAQPKESEETMPPVEETLACPNCSTPIPEQDMRFCPDCGTKVRE